MRMLTEKNSFPTQPGGKIGGRGGIGMFGLGMGELIIILVIVLVIFGAGKLPEIGSSLGKGIKSFKKAMGGEEEDEKSSSEEEDKP